MSPHHAALDGIPISLEAPAQVMESVSQAVAARQVGACVAITNTESMYHALRRPDHLAFIRQAAHSLCDGVGVIAAGWFWGLKVARYNGPIAMVLRFAEGIERAFGSEARGHGR